MVVIQKQFQNCGRCVRIAFIATILLSMVSCSTKHPVTIPRDLSATSPSVKLNTVSIDQQSTTEQTTATKLSLFYQDWQHTPYRYGGNSKKGIDCSAFSQKTYKQVFSHSLPRTVATQINVGHKVSRAQLRPGDLVFFKTGRTTRHVGVYLRNGTFMHASTSSGVMQSQLSNRYWNRRFITARTLYDQK